MLVFYKRMEFVVKKGYIKNFLKYKNLLFELTKKGVVLKYRRSYFGLIWSLLEPLLMMVVLTVIFGTLFGNKSKEFPVYILSGRLLYTFFSQATTTALKSIRNNGSMIKKIYVPKYLYPMSGILFNFIIFIFSLIVLVGMSFALGVYPSIYAWQTIPVIINLLILAYGIGMILSVVGVFFRDMEYLWNVFLMLVMYTSAIFYEPDRLLSSQHGWILKLNPLFCAIQNFRSGVFGSPLNYKMFFYTLGFGVLSIIVGNYFFYKKQDTFVLYI